MSRPLVVVLGLLLALSMPMRALAHEFWIEPLDFTVAEGKEVFANIRVGQMLKGNADPYISSSFTRFTITDGEETRPVDGQLGNRPALRIKPQRPGLHIAAYQSRAFGLTYRTAEKFARFLTNEGLKDVPAAHKARGLPEAGFREAYTRFGKSLIAVGEEGGEDRALGLRLELIALDDPYSGTGPIRLQLLYEGDPDPDIQIAAFRRGTDGEITREVKRTDAHGRASFARGNAKLTLISAVKMVEPAPELAEERNVVWHSLWASLTYGAR